MGAAIVTGILLFLQVLCYLVLIYFVLCFILKPTNRLLQVVARFSEPLLQPIRRVLGRVFPRMPIDFAPVVFIILVRLLGILLSALARL